MTPLLRVRNLSKTFTVREGLLRSRTLHAVQNVDVDIHRGEVVALVGESGSGKSTVARMIARLLPPSAGSIELATSEGSYRRRVQMIFQDPFGSLNPVHPIGHHLTRPLLRHHRATRRTAAAQAITLLESVGLTPGADYLRRHPHELSGGQRQRVAIARALAVEPELILADEPTSMLDVSIRVGILNLLCELKERRGISFLYITHDLASARYFADRTLVMYAGRVVEAAPSDTLMDAPAHPYTRLLLAAVPDPRGDLQAPLPTAMNPATQTGCPFAARCPEAAADCATEPTFRTSGNRSVSCHRSPDPVRARS